MGGSHSAMSNPEMSKSENTIYYNENLKVNKPQEKNVNSKYNYSGLNGIHKFLKKKSKKNSNKNITNKNIFNFIEHHNLSKPMSISKKNWNKISNNLNSLSNYSNNNNNLPIGYNFCRLIKNISDEYNNIRKLGKGKYGIVYLANPKSKIAKSKCGSITNVALKTINVTKTKDVKKVFIEAITLLRSAHPFITNIFDFMFDEIQNTYYIIIEYASGGELYANIIKKKFLSELNLNQKLKFVQTITKQLLIALNELHQKNIIHSDLKPENIVCMKEGYLFLNEPYIKIADFGLSFLYAEKSKKGSPLYMAYEIYNESLFENNENNENLLLDMLKKTDIWSLGCIIYEILLGYNVFETARSAKDLKTKQLKLLENINDENYILNKIREIYPSITSEQESKIINISNFLKKCFTENKSRYSALELIRFLNNNQSKLLYNP